jgi:hypothetical protein
LVAYCYLKGKGVQRFGKLGYYWEMTDFHEAILSFSTLAGMPELVVLYTQWFKERMSSFLRACDDHQSMNHIRALYLSMSRPSWGNIYRTLALAEFARRL